MGSSRLAAFVLAAVLVAHADRTRAQCTQPLDLSGLSSSVWTTLQCERQRLTKPEHLCNPMPPPACAGTVVDDLSALAGVPGFDFQLADQLTLSRARRCQQCLVRAIAKYTRSRLGAARSGAPTSDAERSAASFLKPIASQCATPVGVTIGGARVPRTGAACDAIIPPPGASVPGDALMRCVESALKARLERLLRPLIRPNVVLILTDDQPAWTMDVLTSVHDQIAFDGLEFVEAAPQVALCAPSRASVLTGQYAQHHHVLTNLSPDDVTAFDDSSTIATWLHDVGYRTGFIGKYLNGYAPPAVPQGWDTWQAFVLPDYFNYDLVDEHGLVTHYGSAPAAYSTDVLAHKAVEFIEAGDDRPFLLIVALFGPHGPSTPAPRHAGRYATTPPWRPPSYDEEDVSDKPAWVRALASLGPSDQLAGDVLHAKVLETLLSVDDAVSAVVQALRTAHKYDDTFIAYTTDNGFEFGEHRYFAKGDPYEGSSHIPLVVRYPRLGALPPTSGAFVSLVDLAPTWAELAGTTPGLAVDGTSLMGLLDGTGTATWRQDRLVEAGQRRHPGST